MEAYHTIKGWSCYFSLIHFFFFEGISHLFIVSRVICHFSCFANTKVYSNNWLDWICMLLVWIMCVYNEIILLYLWRCYNNYIERNANNTHFNTHFLTYSHRLKFTWISQNQFRKFYNPMNINLQILNSNTPPQAGACIHVICTKLFTNRFNLWSSKVFSKYFSQLVTWRA